MKTPVEKLAIQRDRLIARVATLDVRIAKLCDTRAIARQKLWAAENGIDASRSSFVDETATRYR